MAWLQNLAGKAEDLLNKIDQNAATVLSDPLGKSSDKNVEHNRTSILIDIPKTDDNGCDSTCDNISIIDENSQYPDDEISHHSALCKERLDETNANWAQSTQSPKSGSLQSSFIGDEKAAEEIAKLELENQNLTEHLISLQHIYSELKNDYLNTKEQLERANEIVVATQNEMEQYRARAHKILQEKQKLIAQNRSDVNPESNPENQMLISYIEQLKKKIESQQNINNELAIKFQNTSEELDTLQREFKKIQINHQVMVKDLEYHITNEQTIRASLEEECQLKNKELQKYALENNALENKISSKEKEIDQLKVSVRQKIENGNSNELETKYHSLIETLMSKQSAIETATTEKNALRLQLERLEGEYNKVVNQLQMQNTCVQQKNVVEMEGVRSDIPKLMKISPLDQGVTRRVKTAYSSLDAVSIRTGVFLRRYPAARIFVLCYMVLLHMWVLIILCTDVPTAP